MPLRALGHERRVAAPIGGGRTAGDVEHVIDRVVEKCAVVADDDQRLAELAEVALEPLDCLEIEVVGGLVEEHQVYRRRQLRGESHPAAFPAAQRGEGPRPRVGWVEAQALQYGIHARLQPVTPRVRELLLITAEAFEVRRGDAIAQLGEACRLPAEAVLQRYEVAVAGRRRVPDGGGPAEDSGLVEHRHAQARLAHDGTPGRHQTAVDQPEERRLTGAVPTHDTPALARGDRERDTAEEGGRTELHRDVGKGQDGHEGNMAEEGIWTRLDSYKLQL